MIVGQEEIVDGVLMCMLAGGHALLEGVPGLGKTMLVRTLAETHRTRTFSRIQFTPDLMPADIVGTNVIVEDHGGKRFEFQKGPIFANIVLADEINRATPKTQSALLEAMSEGTVTVAKQTYMLEEPFFVLATQNPLEMEGTYPLPEAQLDRFFFKLDRRVPGQGRAAHDPRSHDGRRRRRKPQPVLDKARILEMRELVRQVPLARHIQDYAVRVVLATHPENPEATPMSQAVRALRRVAARRAGVLLAAKIRALLEGRFAVVDRRRPPRRAAGAAPPRAPQLRGRGRRRQDRRDHRRDPEGDEGSLVAAPAVSGVFKALEPTRGRRENRAEDRSALFDDGS